MMNIDANWAWLNREAQKDRRISPAMMRRAERAFWGMLESYEYRPPEPA